MGVFVLFVLLSCFQFFQKKIHVLLHCTMYTGVRELLFKYASYISSDLMSLDDIDKTNNAMLLNMLKCAKTCYQILNIRKTLVTQM